MNLRYTGVGDGIAIPHVRNPIVLHVNKPLITLCFLDTPVDFGALDGLPVDMRTTVILVSLQGLSHGEVAVVQNVSEGTIAWRMHEARRRLHDAMAPEKLQRKRELSADLARVLGEHGLLIPVMPKGRA